MQATEATIQAILKDFPVQAPFRFIDDIEYLDEHKIEGHYTYKSDEYFYEGHYPNNPITPGTVLTETMLQIGLLAFGMHLRTVIGESYKDSHFLLLSNTVQFRKIVVPNTKVKVIGERVSYKREILRTSVKMVNIEDQTLIAKGNFSGLITANKA